jgi:hypothetical protein
MDARFNFDGSSAAAGASADQQELLRLVRAMRQELAKRTPDIGCMTPEEIHSLLCAWDQVLDLHVFASLHDDRIAFLREKLQRMVWSSE